MIEFYLSMTLIRNNQTTDTKKNENKAENKVTYSIYVVVELQAF